MSSPASPERTMSIARAFSPQYVKPSAHFSATRIDSSVLKGDADPFMSLDHFRMSAPTFAPHPHAGFSAVTYVLPESAIGMENRDSRGDNSNIPPGAVHWTAAGSGIVHEEVPDLQGQMVEGFQIFVKQSIDQEEGDPMIFHADNENIPEVDLGGGGKIRVVAGCYNNAAASFAAPSPVVAFDIFLPAGEQFDWIAPWSQGTCCIYLFDGAMQIGNMSWDTPKVVVMERGGGKLRIVGKSNVRMFVFGGEPLDLPIYSVGPFAMSSEAKVHSAIKRFRSGAMGSLAGA
jgi:redox-sensitive bicupin YhaK (pirin superfamily)